MIQNKLHLSIGLDSRQNQQPLLLVQNSDIQTLSYLKSRYSMAYEIKKGTEWVEAIFFAFVSIYNFSWQLRPPLI